MTTGRRLALKIVNTVVRFASPGAQDWAKAMLREMDFIENDWTALLWALGSTRMLLWRRDAPLAELCDIPRAAQRFQKRISRRNLREYAASAFVIVGVGYYSSVFHSALIRTGCVLAIAGTLFMVYTLHKRGSARTVSAEFELRTCIDFHRKELQRQRDLLRDVWSWCLLPLVPGMLVFRVGLLEQALERPNASAQAGVIPFALFVVMCAGLFVGIGKLNRWAADKLQREIDAIDKLEKES